LFAATHDLVAALDVDAHDVSGVASRVLVHDAQPHSLLLASVQPQPD